MAVNCTGRSSGTTKSNLSRKICSGWLPNANGAMSEGDSYFLQRSSYYQLRDSLLMGERSQQQFAEVKPLNSDERWLLYNYYIAGLIFSIAVSDRKWEKKSHLILKPANTRLWHLIVLWIHRLNYLCPGLGHRWCSSRPSSLAPYSLWRYRRVGLLGMFPSDSLPKKKNISADYLQWMWVLA